MLIYHGSTDIVSVPEIREANRTLDYGCGFYATTSFEQARQWVLRRLYEQKRSVGFINIYAFEPKLLQGCKTLSFNSPTEEWVDFVMANRTQEGYCHDFDVVYGPVANDRVYAAFALFEGHIISKQALIAELKTYKLVDQYLFHTEQALKCITFIEAKEIRL